MNNKLFLFGTGQISRYYTENLNQLSVEIEGYMDNNPEKWGSDFLKRKVYEPDMLKEIEEAEILIACSDIEGVTGQLTQMGIQDRIISINDLIRNRTGEMRDKNQSVECGEIRSIIVDNLNGAWGGAEDWAHKLTLSLAGRGYDVTVIENDGAKAEKELEPFRKEVDRGEKGFSEIYMDLIKWMMKRKPFILFNIWTSEVLWAACYIKRFYPDEIRIISVLLNDSPDLYERQRGWDSYIDRYLCISSRIRDNLIRRSGIDERKVLFREPFIEKARNEREEYLADNGNPLKLCYPCRLVQRQKRADLLPELIENLERAGVNYRLDIVGDGPYEKELSEYVEAHNLSFQIKFHGRLSREALKIFLSEEDVYLNISDFEGTSLTMLEAMACGCVPVVTNVSGVDDFIANMENGLISRIGDMKAVADHLFYLDRNREKIREFGVKSSKIVLDKCDLDRYIDDIERLINMV